MDLFELALKNAPSLKERFDELMKLGQPQQPKALTDFALSIATTGRICINMKQMALLEFLTFGKYMNIYEWAANRAHLSGKQVNEVIQAKLGSYYEKRLAFDACFENSSEFHCGMVHYALAASGQRGMVITAPSLVIACRRTGGRWRTCAQIVSTPT